MPGENPVASKVSLMVTIKLMLSYQMVCQEKSKRVQMPTINHPHLWYLEAVVLHQPNRLMV
uniref:Uncharacterized protein n=1 Tax=Brassica oleracea TaxID=3712 RepID=A0A3P6AMP1_BRAOL|nr:unnamed protein product [Brassica oleracea]